MRRHQKQALTFMLRREQGWAFYEQEPDVWEIIDEEQGRLYVSVSLKSLLNHMSSCRY